MTFYSLGERKSKLNGCFHGGHSQLGLDTAILELNHRVYHRLRMHQNLNILCIDTEKPFGLDNLKPLVHKACRVDCNLATHAPVWMFQRLFKGD